MMQATIDAYLEIDTKAVLKRKLITSYVRTAICLGSLGLCAHLTYNSIAQEDAGQGFLALIVAIFAFFALIGYTPRLLRSTGDYWPTSSIHDNTTKQARVTAAQSAIRTGERLGDDAFRMRRRLKILLFSRLLGAVAMAMVWVAFTWNSQHNLRTAHFERFGTYEAVSIYVHLDGTETITIDPSQSPGSVRRTMEQPSRLQTAATTQDIAAPSVSEAPVESPIEVAPPVVPEVSRAPIVPPNPPLPSYWPPITPGYSATIYERTPSGALKVVEIRLQYADGAMHAVGP